VLTTTRTSLDDASGRGVAAAGGGGVAVVAEGVVVKSRKTSTVPSRRSVQLTWDRQTGTLWKAPRHLSLTQRCPLSLLVFGVESDGVDVEGTDVTASHAHVSLCVCDETALAEVLVCVQGMGVGKSDGLPSVLFVRVRVCV
jgi:hypothetical protein